MRLLIKGIYIALFAAMVWNCAGCALTKTERQANRMVKKLEKWERKHPKAFKEIKTETVVLDTLITPIQIETTKVYFDTVSIDRVLTQYVTDTTIVPRIRYEVLQAISSDTLRADSLFLHAEFIIDSTGISGRVWSDSIYVFQETEVDKITIEETISQRWWRGFWRGVMVGLLLGILLLIFWKAIKAYFFNFMNKF